VADRWVINASPLVLLAKAGILHFLPVSDALVARAIELAGE